MSQNIHIDDTDILGLIPARGGSKSIPLKNIVPLNGKPMLSYVLAAGKASKSLTRLACSTDHEKISNVCHQENIEVFQRPEHLGQDDTPITDVLVDILHKLAEKDGKAPFAIALLQPTSPFMRGEDIDACIKALRDHPEADSSQTVAPVIHNTHAFNQRIIENGRVQFRFLEERRAAYNKQRKPKHYVFGNLVVTSSRALLEGKDCFGDISIPVEIPRAYALDVDTAEDVDYATYLLSQNKIETALSQKNEKSDIRQAQGGSGKEHGFASLSSSLPDLIR